MAKRSTLKRVLVGWFLFCAVTSLLLWAGLQGQEERCRATDDYLCFDDRAVLVLVGVPAVVVVVVGTVVIAVAWNVVEARRGRKAAPPRRPHGRLE